MRPLGRGAALVWCESELALHPSGTRANSYTGSRDRGSCPPHSLMTVAEQPERLAAAGCSSLKQQNQCELIQQETFLNILPLAEYLFAQLTNSPGAL